jgi:hypothetical protein
MMIHSSALPTEPIKNGAPQWARPRSCSEKHWQFQLDEAPILAPLRRPRAIGAAVTEHLNELGGVYRILRERGRKVLLRQNESPAPGCNRGTGAIESSADQSSLLAGYPTTSVNPLETVEVGR